MGQTLGERVEVRRLVAWFDGKFAEDVTRNLNDEKYIKRSWPGVVSRDASALRAGYAKSARPSALSRLAGGDAEMAGRLVHLARRFRRGGRICRCWISPATWTGRSARARANGMRGLKSRPSFRALLADRVPGMTPPAHYADLDF